MNSLTFKEKLKEKGCKLTTQRRAVLDILLEQYGNHLSTEEIYNCVKVTYPEIGLATVYRTMQLFEKMGIIDKLNFDDGVSRFELKREEEKHQHHHLICQHCNRVLEVEEDLLFDIEQEIAKKYKFQVTNHNVIFYGECENCIDKPEE
ncbi:MAG: transcriptional repressor [Epulopiscium sp. Nele67-Bin004]|nr:MAG: transcriptional repressor [Epulopiscium sp. Nele67-Bin004]